MALTNGQVMEAFRTLLESIPKGKRVLVCGREGVMVELGLKQAWKLLEGLRRYILDPHTKMGGEDSPFVKAIDEIMPRETENTQG